MAKKILVINGSPVKNGNTATLVKWFCEGAGNGSVEVVNAAFLKYKSSGCISCRKCQKIKEYRCVIPDDAQAVLVKMGHADAIVMATPLYFYGPSAQLKLIMDRMFSLYKWDNDAGTMKTPMKGKTLALIASAFEDVGLKDLEKPFKTTAEYSGMKFMSLLVPNSGESGEVAKLPGIKEKAVAFGRKVAK